MPPVANAPSCMPARNSFYQKKRTSPSNSTALKRKGSTSSRPSSRRSSRSPSVKSTAESSTNANANSGRSKAFRQLEREYQQNLLEPEYESDVVSYMRDIESQTMASPELMDMQPELQWYMRPYLVDFLIEIHQQFRLRPETLYLAMNIVDRYVSKRIVYKKHYQLVGCAALWIAAKFEDAKDRVPTVHDLAQMCCNAYDESAFIQMEGHVLSTIGWMIGHPTAEAWLRIECSGNTYEEPATQHVARFLMEVCLFHRDFIQFAPSALAAGAVMLSKFILGHLARPPTTGTSVEDAVRVAHLIDGLLGGRLDELSTILVKKYSFAYYSRASTVVQEWYLRKARAAYGTSSSPSTPFSFHAARPEPCTPMRRNGSEDSMDASSTCSSDVSPVTSRCSSSCGMDEDDEEMPLTPLSMYSVLDPFAGSNSSGITEGGGGGASAAGGLGVTTGSAAKENVRPDPASAATTAPLPTVHVNTVPLHKYPEPTQAPMQNNGRQPLHVATWQVNVVK